MAAKILLSNFSSKAYRDRERFVELSRFIERSLNVELKRRMHNASNELERITDEVEAAFVAECHAEDIFQVESDFPRIQRYALFVSMMGMIEANFVGLCRVAQRVFSLSEEFNSHAPRVVARGIKYLEQNVNIDMSRFHYYINLAQNLASIRNCIAHAEGFLAHRDDAESIRGFIEDIPTTTIDERYNLVLQEGFVENSTHEMHTFVNKLHDALKEKFNTHQNAPKHASELTAGNSI